MAGASKLYGKLYGNYMLKENDLEDLKDFSQSEALTQSHLY